MKQRLYEPVEITFTLQRRSPTEIKRLDQFIGTFPSKPPTRESKVVHLGYVDVNGCQFRLLTDRHFGLALKLAWQ